MRPKQPVLKAEPRRGILARPLDALVFLLPLIVFYEVVSLSHPQRVIAFDLLRRFFELFGPVGMWVPGAAVVVILIATHLASGEKWTIRWARVGMMYVEAGIMAVPLFALNWAVPLAASATTGLSPVGDIAVGMGAGIYEELVFRLIVISVVMMVGVDVLGFRRAGVAVLAVIGSSLLFAAHHHQPLGHEQFDLIRFIFRAVAGGYLALIFWYRGYGPAAGCHAAYNVGLVGAAALTG